MRSMMLLAGLLFSYAWCSDNVVFTGTVTDSTNSNAPVAGIRVAARGVLSSNPQKETTTNAQGRFLIMDAGDCQACTPMVPVSAWTINTSYNYAYQYKTKTASVPGTANRADGVADTIVVNFSVGSVSPAPDTLMVRGTVLDSKMGTPVSGAAVKFYFKNPFVLYPVDLTAPSYDTLYSSTGDDGTFAIRGVNAYGLKGGYLTIVKTGYNAPKAATWGQIASDTSKASIFDGVLDSIGVTMYPVPTSISGSRDIMPSPLFNGPVSVDLYTLDGRLAAKIRDVTLGNLDEAIRNEHIRSTRPLIAVWYENGARFSRTIVNFTPLTK
jgi:hypothetical protein